MNLYDRLLILGPLTDRQIEEYERQGKYGPERQHLALSILRSKDINERQKREAQKRRKHLKHLIDDLI